MECKFNNKGLSEEVVIKEDFKHEEDKNDLYWNSKNISGETYLSLPKYKCTLILSVKGFDVFISYVKSEKINIFSHNCVVHKVGDCEQVRCEWHLSGDESFELLEGNIKQALAMLKQDDYSFIWSTYEYEKQFRIANESRKKDEPVLLADTVVL